MPSLHHDFRSLDARDDLNLAQIEDEPATMNLNGYIRWVELRMSGMQPAEVMRA
jgi:hypothetical protein